MPPQTLGDRVFPLHPHFSLHTASEPRAAQPGRAHPPVHLMRYTIRFGYKSLITHHSSDFRAARSARFRSAELSPLDGRPRPLIFGTSSIFGTADPIFGTFSGFGIFGTSIFGTLEGILGHPFGALFVALFVGATISARSLSPSTGSPPLRGPRSRSAASAHSARRMRGVSARCAKGLIHSFRSDICYPPVTRQPS